MLFPIDRVFETEKAFVFVLHDDSADRYYLRAWPEFPSTLLRSPAWLRLMESHPEVVAKCHYLQFPGQP